MVAMTGLVLAGGRGRRLGRDKALLRLDGVALFDRVARRLAPVCEEVVIAAGARMLPGCSWRQIADAPGEGPLAGILAGLHTARAPLLAVAAVDMPDVSAALYTQLASRWAGEVAVVPSVEQRLQPLHAVWSVDAAEAVADLLATGCQAPTRVLERLDAAVVAIDAIDATDAIDYAGATADIDTVADLQRRQGG